MDPLPVIFCPDSTKINDARTLWPMKSRRRLAREQAGSYSGLSINPSLFTRSRLSTIEISYLFVKPLQWSSKWRMTSERGQIEAAHVSRSSPLPCKVHFEVPITSSRCYRRRRSGGSPYTFGVKRRAPQILLFIMKILSIREVSSASYSGKS